MGKTQMRVERIGLVATPRSEGERSEPERNGVATSAAGAVTLPSAGASPVPDVEVTAKAVRRRFTAAYKRRILNEADKCPSGGISALLRREGLYASLLSTWKRQREQGETDGLTPRKRGRKASPRNPLAHENERLSRENDRLQKRLKQAEIIIDVQKKLCDILGLTVPPIELNESDE